jgi:pre-mRNA-processing factor 40
MSPTPPPRSASPENLRPTNNNALAAYSARQRETSTPTVKPVEMVVIPPGGFPTHEKAEEAFIYLLKRDGVDETWTWDQTMRKIIMDPLYKALETLAQKKAAFEKVATRRGFDI